MESKYVMCMGKNNWQWCERKRKGEKKNFVYCLRLSHVVPLKGKGQRKSKNVSIFFFFFFFVKS